MPFTMSDLSVIAERADAATPGPWHAEDGHVRAESEPGWVHPIANVNEWRGQEFSDKAAQVNGAFIAQARTDVPALLAEVLRLREGIQEAITLHSVESREAYVLADFLTGLISEVRA